MQTLENLNWTLCWKQMKIMRSLKLCQTFIKKWISIDRRIMCWQCHKKLFSFYSADLIRKIDANIVENVEKNLRSRRIFFFLNQNKNTPNWKCLDFWILKSSSKSEKKVNLIDKQMYFLKILEQKEWFRLKISDVMTRFLMNWYWIHCKNWRKRWFY